MTTPFHSKYFAHSLMLKRASGDVRNLSRSIANARVDLNPHQVHAALFALKSPLSMGAVLADEVGLGKTIEAGLIIAQKWAERKRHILLIVPAFLRKQWEQELQEKFFLPIQIFDSKTLKQKQSEGLLNPLAESSYISICSYPFAAQYSHLLKAVSWDLVVIDEAHRMRNVYKTSNKRAKAISEALEGRLKILLTATPLQNNLMELYGLVSVIDPHLFGDATSFREQFVNCRDEEYRNQRLKSRLEPLVVRTLRKQVMEYVSFTGRIAITHNYYPNDDEQKLYEGVSAYLQKETLYALPKGRRQLITVILRKLLASSPQAIASTLKKLVKGLEKQVGPEALLNEEEIELLDTLESEWNEENEGLVDTDEPEVDLAIREETKQELIELQSYVDLAESIKKSSKSQSLLVALKEAFSKAQTTHAPQKAVIFTESRKTQKFLFELLSASGYQDQIVCISGSNSDIHSKEIYQEWIAKHKRTNRVTGSKPVDIKAALIDRFRNDASILIATEAASEGVNLQFCSLIINYDLPWNPQRVEQRIGRCHRYGQKHDVVVVNFINKRNEADQRVYELLNEKFKLFSGVFGASDEVLGIIESGVDIEKRIVDIYQNCRSSKEIQEAFDQIRAELDLQIQESLGQTKENIFEHLDEEVAALLKVQKDVTSTSLEERKKWLFRLIEGELEGLVKINHETHSFTFPENPEDTSTYYLNLEQSEANNGVFFREDHDLAEKILQKAASRSLDPAHVVFDYTSYDGKVSALDPLVGSTGWLEVERLKVNTFEQEEFLLLAAHADDGTPVDPEIIHKLFSLPAYQTQNLSQTPPSFQKEKEVLIQKHLEEVEQQAGTFYESRVEQIENWSEDLKISLEKEIKALDKEIKETRRFAKSAPTLEKKLSFQKEIRRLEGKRNTKRRSLFDEQDRIERERDSIIERLEGDLKPKTSTTQLFTLRWEVK